MKRLKLYIKNITFSFYILFSASKILFAKKMLSSFLSVIITFLNLILIKNIVNLLEKSELYFIIIYIVLFCFLSLIENFNRKFSNKTNCLYEDRINFYLDEILVTKISRLKYENFDQATVLNKVADAWDLITAIQSLPELLFAFITELGKILVFSIALFHLSIWAMLAMTQFVIISAVLYKKANDTKWSVERKSVGFVRMMDYYKECLGQYGFFNMKVFGYQDLFMKKYEKIWNKWHDERKHLSEHSILISFFSLISISLGETIILILSIFRYMNSKILIGDVFYYFSLVQEIESACEGFIISGSGLSYAMDELLTVRELLEMDSIDKLGTKTTSQKYEISFSHVWFKYPNQKEYVLKDCNFTIGNGEVIGLVGKNGAGKSTIIKLILALYSPTKGKILLNGRSYDEYEVSDLRKKIGVMFHDYNRYSLTLKENIALSELENINNIDMLNAAISNSGCEELLKKVKFNYDTQLTKRFTQAGEEFSVGQWQRLAVARAFFGNKSMYLLDEPSASLDPVAEDRMISAFKRLVNGKSGVIVTHRLSSLSLVDKILVLDEGRVVEKGKQNELLIKNGIYTDFYLKQANRYK